jgi:hypothetical protein
MPSLYPTHHCFDDALDFVQDLVRKGARPEWLIDTCTIVHAICRIPDGAGFDPDDVDGRLFSHAWVELDGHVFQAGLRNLGDDPVKQRVWYATTPEAQLERLRPTRVWRYTLKEAWEHNERHMTFGPWEPELIELCRNRRKTT